MQEFQINPSLNWIKDLRYIVNFGKEAKPRNMPIFEILAFTSVIDMNAPIIAVEKRGLGYRFMAAEAAWILSGDNRVETIEPYSRHISDFSDDGEVFFGAYGPKISDQLGYVIETLHRDPDSRQAVINIWREKPAKSKDIPCTLSLQFLIRDDKLETVATMRSSDLWLGHPYDIFNFSALSFVVLLEVNKIRRKNKDRAVALGLLSLTAGSKHLYLKNLDKVKEILDEDSRGSLEYKAVNRPIFDYNKYEHAHEFIGALWDAANTTKGVLSLTE